MTTPSPAREALDYAKRRTDERFGLNAIERLVPPDLAIRYAQAVSLLATAERNGDEQAAARAALSCIRGLKAMEDAVQATWHPDLPRRHRRCAWCNLADASVNFGVNGRDYHRACLEAMRQHQHETAHGSVSNADAHRARESAAESRCGFPAPSPLDNPEPPVSGEHSGSLGHPDPDSDGEDPFEV